MRSMLGVRYPICRAVPDIVFALIFVTAVGLGPFAGLLALICHNTGVMGKLWAESMEEIDAGPQEALRTAGASRIQQVANATLLWWFRNSWGCCCTASTSTSAGGRRRHRPAHQPGHLILPLRCHAHAHHHRARPDHRRGPILRLDPAPPGGLNPRKGERPSLTLPSADCRDGIEFAVQPVSSESYSSATIPAIRLLGHRETERPDGAQGYSPGIGGPGACRCAGTASRVFINSPKACSMPGPGARRFWNSQPNCRL